MKKLLLPLLFCLLTGYFLSSCNTLKEPELMGIENVRVSRLGLKESSLTLNLHYFNPNNKRLKLKKAEGDAWLDGNPLGHFTIDTLIHIPAKGDFRLPVTLKMNMNHVVENIAAAFMDKLVTIKVNGVAKAGKGIIYINYPLRYEGKQKLSELLR